MDQVFNKSFILQVVKDLSNNDKHGYPTRKGDHGHSGKRPKLVELSRNLRLSTNPGEGSSIGITLNRDGTPRILGSGSSAAITTGSIIDKDGNQIGDLHECAIKAVIILEQLWGDLSNGGKATK